MALALVFMTLIESACTTPGIQLAAPDQVATAAKTGMIKNGKAHVYAFLGTWHRVGVDIKVGSPSNFFVNGVNVGGINKNECMFIELPPGTYNFAWQERVSSSPVTASPRTFTIAPDQNLFVAFDMGTGVGQMFGLVGALAEGVSGAVADPSVAGLQTIQDMKIVLPNEAMVATLRPMGQ